LQCAFFIMAYFARKSEGNIDELIPLARPFSNFQFVRAYFGAVPGQLEPLRRILSQVRQHEGKTMVVETLSTAEDLRQENEDLQTRCGGKIQSQIYRLSFFKKNVQSERHLRSATPGEFIGYAIVKSDYKIPDNKALGMRVYESVIKSARYQNNFIHGGKKWNCKVGDNEFEINGYLYAQQNALTNCCAHVALRTAATSFHSSGDMTYREMNEIVGIDHKKRIIADSKGLFVEEMVAILEATGARCITADYLFSNKEHDLNVPYSKYVYGAIESGFPAIVGFRTKYMPQRGFGFHAVPIFGHTFNDDTWVPSAERSYFKVGSRRYLPSERWISTFIGHDDNWGSNFCIPRDYMEPHRYCENASCDGSCDQQEECITGVIACLPADTAVAPVEAEIAGAEYLFRILQDFPVKEFPENFWATELIDYAQYQNSAVLRPILIETEDYVSHLRSVTDWEGNNIDPKYATVISENIKGWTFWMIEVSVPHLFSSNKRKVGEILIEATSPLDMSESGESNFILARLPGCFVFSADAPDKKSFNFNSSGCPGHVAMYGCEGSR